MMGPRQSGRTTRQLYQLVGAAIYGEQCAYVCCSLNERHYLVRIVLKIATEHGYPEEEIKVRGHNLIYFTSSGGRIAIMSRAQADRPDALSGTRVDRLVQDHESSARNGPLSDWAIASVRPKPVAPPITPGLDPTPIDHEQLKRTKEALDRLE